MSSPRAILLVPSPGDPHGLLAPGACGAVPPTVACFLDKIEGACWMDDPDMKPAALVLAWNGRAVPEGCDRAIRVLAQFHGAPMATSATYSLDQARNIANSAARHLGGEVVML